MPKKITLENFKDVMKKKAAKKGLYENFGQDELRELKERYKYNPYGTRTPEERRIAAEIDRLDDWAMNYTGRD